MSFLYDAVLPSSSRLLAERGDEPRKGRQEKAPHNSRSLLGSLVQIAKDPLQALGGAIDHAALLGEGPSGPAFDRRQVLYARMNNVCILISLACLIYLTNVSLGPNVRRV